MSTQTEKLQRDIANLEQAVKYSNVRAGEELAISKEAGDRASQHLSDRGAHEKGIANLQAELAALEKPQGKCEEWWVCHTEGSLKVAHAVKPLSGKFTRVIVPITDREMTEAIRKAMPEGMDLVTTLALLKTLGMLQKGGE